MTIRKDSAISSIHNDFETFANLVLTQLDLMEHLLSSEKLIVENQTLEQTMTTEDEIDKKEVQLSDKVVNTIVLYQPVASDLRRIIACYRILISLERIGDIVINVIRFIPKIKNRDVFNHIRKALSGTVSLSIKMVRRSMLSYMNDDRELALETIRDDIEFKKNNQKTFRKLMVKADETERNKHLLMSIITIKEMLSNIDRIADHATNIAEAAIYSIEGKDIRHHKTEH